MTSLTFVEYAEDKIEELREERLFNSILIYLDDELEAPERYIRTETVGETIYLLDRYGVADLALTLQSKFEEILDWIEQRVIKDLYYHLPYIKTHTGDPRAKRYIQDRVMEISVYHRINKIIKMYLDGHEFSKAESQYLEEAHNQLKSGKKLTKIQQDIIFRIKKSKS